MENQNTHLLSVINNSSMDEKTKNQLKNIMSFNHYVLEQGRITEQNNKLGILTPMTIEFINKFE